MRKRLIAELADFLDSPQGRALEGPRSQARELGHTIFECLLDRFGTLPWEANPEDLTGLLEFELPRHFGTKDPAAERVPALLEAYLDFAEGEHLGLQGFELRSALARSSGAFLSAVAAGSGDPQAPPPTAPLTTRGSKVRRNDPCPCGSGRKFKKCCGAGA